MVTNVAESKEKLLPKKNYLNKRSAVVSFVTMSTANSSWFYDLLRSALARPGMTQRALAEKIGVTHSAISLYLSDSREPALAVAMNLLDFMGGDISRALPGWAPEAPSMMRIRVEGQVAAGVVSWWGEDVYEVEAIEHTWKNSKYWAHTRGAVVFLEVSGDSMSPDFHPGDLIACREPLDGKRLPAMTPAIIETPDGATFKMLHNLGESIWIGQPINAGVPPVLLRGREWRVRYAVLGRLDRWQDGAPIGSAGRGVVLMDSKARSESDESSRRRKS